MPAKAGQIVIDITAGTGKFVVDMDKATGKIREFGSAGVSETKATRAAFKVLEGDIANNSRAAEQFAEKFLGIGKLAAVAFPVVGAAALIGTLVEGGRKVKDFFDGIVELPGKVSGAFRELTAPLQTSNDELQVLNDRLANDIAKLEGRRPNNLKLMLDEAIESADKLADSLDKDLSKLAKTVTDGNVSWSQKWLGNMADSPDLKARFGDNGSFQGEVNKILDDGTAALHRATDAKSKDAAQQKLNNDLIHAYGVEVFATNQILNEAEGKQKAHDRNPFAERDQSGRINELTGIIRDLRLKQSGISLGADNASLSDKKTDLSAGAEERKSAAETLARLGRELAEARAAQADAMERINIEENNELNALADTVGFNDQNVALVKEIYDTKRVAESSRLIEQYGKSIDDLTKRFGEMAKAGDKSFSEQWSAEIKEGTKQLEDGAKAVTKWAEAYNKLTEARDSEALRHNVAMAGAAGNANDPLGTLELQQSIERADIEDRYEEKLKSGLSDKERSIALGEKELELQKLQNQYEEKAAELRHKSLRDFMVEMQGQSKNLGDVLYDGAHEALDKISDDFATLVEHPKKTSVSQIFGDSLKSIGGDMTKEATKSLAQKGLGALGKLLGIKSPTGKPDGSSEALALWVRMAKDGQGAGGKNPLDGIVPDLPPALSGGKAGLGGILNGIGGFIGNLFGGGAEAGSAGFSTSSITYMAGGGDMDPGRIYGVAEAGEAELVSPKQSSRITPLSKLGGGDTHHHTYNIDARGADLGAHNRISRALEATHNAAVSNSVRAGAEHARRVPRRKR